MGLTGIRPQKTVYYGLDLTSYPACHARNIVFVIRASSANCPWIQNAIGGREKPQAIQGLAELADTRSLAPASTPRSSRREEAHFISDCGLRFEPEPPDVGCYEGRRSRTNSSRSCLLVSLSPCLKVSLSQCLPLSRSPSPAGSRCTARRTTPFALRPVAAAMRARDQPR
jgi:hypothetical protein